MKEWKFNRPIKAVKTDFKDDYSVDSTPILQIIFKDSTVLSFEHRQDCCENVYFDKDSSDELDELPGQTLKSVELVSDITTNNDHGTDEEMRWTFYKLHCDKGDYTILFRGEDNGYYSLAVDVYYRNQQLNEVEY